MLFAQSSPVPDAPSLVPGPPSEPSVGGSTVVDNLQNFEVAVFTGTPLFDTIQSFSSIAGVGVIIFVAFFIIRAVAGGMIGFAAKTAVVGAIIAAMLFNLKAPIQFALGLTSFVESVFAFILDTIARAG